MSKKKRKNKFDIDFEEENEEETKTIEIDENKEFDEEPKTEAIREEIEEKIENDSTQQDVIEEVKEEIQVDNQVQIEEVDTSKEKIREYNDDNSKISSGMDVFTPDNTFGRLVTYFLLAVSFVSVICLLIYTIISSSDLINRLSTIISVLLLSIFALLFLVQSLFLDNKKGRVLVALSSILLTSYSIFTITNDMGVISVPAQEYVPNFTGKNLTEVVNWASNNNVELNQIYETSDSIKEYGIINQDVEAYTLVKNIKMLTVTVSEGPNYEKEVVVPSFIGKSVDDVVKFIDDNYLTNVNIDFKFSEDEREIILTQDNSGQLKRNAVINLTASLGLEDNMVNAVMEDLTNKSIFEASLFLKRNAIKYVLEYDYSNSIKKGYVISQNKETGTEINYKDEEVTLVVSKGPKIKVVNLLDMSVEEITNWVIQNNLKIEFEEEYDEAKKAGDVISTSVKEGDTIEQGALIKVVVSKGQLKMESFNRATDFREWAEKYNVSYKEEYEFSDSVSSGSIIKSSHSVGDVIKNNDTVIIYVSQGKKVNIPNFVGSSKADITKKCSSIGLKCSFSYSGYNDSVAKDVATYQNKKAGSSVASGTSINITLSSGKAKSYNIYIQSSWFSNGNADQTISTLKSKLEAACPGVTFKFVKKSVNTGVGIITKDSPTQGGNQTFVQGKTYTFYIGS